MFSQTSNRFLSSLPPEIGESLIRQSTRLPLPVRFGLYQAEEPPEYAYFLTSGMASVVSTMEDGATAEVGVIGNEGIVGAVHILGPAKVSTSSFIQLDGDGLRIPLDKLRAAFRTSEEIRSRVLEFIQMETLNITQIAACNRLHEAEERLARWLLMAQDRTQYEVMHFTQEFLGMMLGARRTTVTLVAGSLQRGGLIEYQRGRVRIPNRENLETAACDCYKITKHLFANLYKSPTVDAGNDGARSSTHAR